MSCKTQNYKEIIENLRKELIEEITILCSQLKEELYNTDSIPYVNWIKYIHPDGTFSTRGDAAHKLDPQILADMPVESLVKTHEILLKNKRKH